jgi:Domain of unknown function (DUF4124)
MPPPRETLAPVLLGLLLVVRPAPGAGATTVYRCVDARGRVELRQRPCTQGEQQTLQVEDRPVGWVPRPLHLPPLPHRRTEPARAARRGGSATRDTKAERCFKTRQRLEAVSRQLRAGYRPAAGERLKARRRQYEDYLDRFCE